MQSLEELKATHEEVRLTHDDVIISESTTHGCQVLDKVQREASEMASALMEKADAVEELDSRLTAARLKWESEESLLSKSLSESKLQCQALQGAVDRLKADLGSERTTVSARNEVTGVTFEGQE